MKRSFAWVVVALVALPLCSAASAHAQLGIRPQNDLPNPYRTVEGWAKMPEGRAWGSTSAVEVDKDGVSIWVAERCGANSCAGSNLDPVLKFDANGNLVKSFGAGMIVAPHGIFVDADGNVWVTDCACTGGGGDMNSSVVSVLVRSRKLPLNSEVKERGELPGISVAMVKSST